MKRIIAVLILLGVAAGCGTSNHRGVAGAGEVNNHEGFAPWPHPTQEQEYLAGFMDGYHGVLPLDGGLHSPYQQGLRDGYHTGRRDEMQRR